MVQIRRLDNVPSEVREDYKVAIPQPPGCSVNMMSGHKAAIDDSGDLMSRFWFLTFANNAGWLGGCIIESRTFVEALEAARQQKLHPGGECKGIQLAKERLALIPDSLRNTMLGKEDVDFLRAIAG